MLTESERNLGVIPAAADNYPRGSPDSDNLDPFEIMTFQERVAALDFHEAELEWFDWEFLSNRRSENTARGIEVIQRISGRIVRSTYIIFGAILLTFTKRNMGLNVRYVARMRGAYDLILHLVESESRMIELAGGGGPYPNGALTQCTDTQDLVEMAGNAITRLECNYIANVRVSKLLTWLSLCSINAQDFQSGMNIEHA